MIVLTHRTAWLNTVRDDNAQESARLMSASFSLSPSLSLSLSLFLFPFSSSPCSLKLLFQCEVWTRKWN